MDIFEIALVPIALAIGLSLLAFWLWMLIDCIRHESKEGNERIIWVLVIVFTKFLGAAIYYFVRRPERMRLHSVES